MIVCHRRGASAFLCYDTTREVEDAEDGENACSDDPVVVETTIHSGYLDAAPVSSCSSWSRGKVRWTPTMVRKYLY